jgi:hypothetical protein
MSCNYLCITAQDMYICGHLQCSGVASTYAAEWPLCIAQDRTRRCEAGCALTVFQTGQGGSSKAGLPSKRHDNETVMS